MGAETKPSPSDITLTSLWVPRGNRIQSGTAGKGREGEFAV